ncbi:MAG: RNA polymerase sigma factor [Candidatus Promineifilaceae bacterium]
MDYAALDDHALMQLIVDADDAALAALYDRYNRLIFSVALRTVGNRNSAEEITLDIFTRVWDKAHTYRPDLASVTVWLTRMTRNRSIDLLRREGSRAESRSVSWEDVTREPRAQSNPEASTNLHIAQAYVRQAIANLSPEQQELLALAYFKGYSHSKISRELGIPLGTVKTRIRTSMRLLRRALQTDTGSFAYG